MNRARRRKGSFQNARDKVEERRRNASRYGHTRN
jgi:hypothetical protein